MKKILTVLIAATLMSSCVTSKVHKDLQSKYNQIASEKIALEEENQDLKSQLEESNAKLDRVEKELRELKDETALLKRQKEALESDFNTLKESYNLLTNSSNSMLSETAKKNLKLIADLEKSKNLLEEENAKIRAKEKKIKELEFLMKERENYLNMIKNSLSDALRGFEGQGLSVEQKNGKVYVSLENRLLFPSGSWQINANGQQAIEDLAEVLAKQDDLNIVVEGHTDSDPYRGSSEINDNWDLSVKRATSVVKKLTQTRGIDPKRITAAGRSKHLPVATNSNSTGKAKNRRIEVIIEPDLRKIEEMLNTL